MSIDSPRPAAVSVDTDANPHDATTTAIDAKAMIADAVARHRHRDGSEDTGTPVPSPVKSVAAHPVLFIFGVLLPACVIVVEAATGMCRKELFDPMPTWWHTALISLVPAGNLALLLHLSGTWQLRAPWIAVLNGLVTGIAAFYALLFLPLTPFALVAILIGIGILPLAPLASFVVSLRLVRHLRASKQTTGAWSKRSFWSGFAAALLAVVVTDVPLFITRIAMAQATSEDAATRERGIRLMRTWGSTELLLDLCYGRSTRPSGPLSIMLAMSDSGVLDRPRPVTGPQPAREVYYRVTGKPFTMATPRAAELRGRATFDLDLGGREVGGTVPGLSLITSRIDGSLNADDAVAYFEWVFEVRNAGLAMSEARMTLALPPGAVVSRVTLWVNGVEEEAAFAGRAEVRAAYERVVRRAQDPFLVTTNGADRVLAQAFPVLPNGGVMKFKIGITAPLELEPGADRARLVMPAMIDRNFAVGDDVRHAVWLESKRPLTASSPGLTVTSLENGAVRLVGEIGDRGLASARPVLILSRDPARMRSEATNPETGSAVQEIVAAAATPNRTLMLVVDGSVGTGPHVKPILAALASLPAGQHIGLAIAGESGVVIAPQPWSLQLRARFTAALNAESYVGGADNTQALVAALMAVAGQTDNHIVWIHGAQPVQFARTKARFEQASERLGPLPGLSLYALTPGPNLMLNDAPWRGEARDIPATGDITADLSRALKRLTGVDPVPVQRRTLVVRPGLEQEPHMPPVIVASAKGSNHLVRLAAHDEIQALLRASGRKAAKPGAAVEIAALHRLVTPVSGAVVLETAQQYREAGLVQGMHGTKGSVPTVPEPHEWALLLLAALGLGWLHWSRRRNVGPLCAGRHLGPA